MDKKAQELISEALRRIDDATIAIKYIGTGLALGLGLKSEGMVDANYLSIGQIGNCLRDAKKAIIEIEQQLTQKEG